MQTLASNKHFKDSATLQIGSSPGDVSSYVNYAYFSQAQSRESLYQYPLSRWRVLGVLAGSGPASFFVNDGLPVVRFCKRSFRRTGTGQFQLQAINNPGFVSHRALTEPTNHPNYLQLPPTAAVKHHHTHTPYLTTLSGDGVRPDANRFAEQIEHINKRS